MVTGGRHGYEFFAAHLARAEAARDQPAEVLLAGVPTPSRLLSSGGYDALEVHHEQEIVVCLAPDGGTAGIALDILRPLGGED